MNTTITIHEDGELVVNRGLYAIDDPEGKVRYEPGALMRVKRSAYALRQPAIEVVEIKEEKAAQAKPQTAVKK
jgi:hypothetical protein